MTRPLAFLPAACAVLTVLCLTPASARADEEPPAHIAVVDGSAVVEHEASAEPAVPNVPLVPGDRVRTDRGRVEILFSDGVVLQMGFGERIRDVDALVDFVRASVEPPRARARPRTPARTRS